MSVEKIELPLTEYGNHVLTESMVRELERKPCACGKRKTAEPQIPVEPIKVETDKCGARVTGEMPVVCSLHLRCGVCDKIHFAIQFKTIPTFQANGNFRMLKCEPKPDNNCGPIEEKVLE